MSPTNSKHSSSARPFPKDAKISATKDFKPKFFLRKCHLLEMKGFRSLARAWPDERLRNDFRLETLVNGKLRIVLDKKTGVIRQENSTANPDVQPAPLIFPSNPIVPPPKDPPLDGTNQPLQKKTAPVSKHLTPGQRSKLEKILEQTSNAPVTLNGPYQVRLLECPSASFKLLGDKDAHLDEEVIGRFMALLQVVNANDKRANIVAKPSHVYSYHVRTLLLTDSHEYPNYKWTTVKSFVENLPACEVFKLSMLLIPIQMDSLEWILAHVDLEGHVVHVYDGTGGEHTGYATYILQCLKDMCWVDFGPGKDLPSDWKIDVSNTGIPTDIPTCDAGVFVSLMAAYLIKGKKKWNFKNERINDGRRRIAVSLVEGKLLL
jgi:Ulp1 protease family, C-terminal catalytic domain